MPEPTVLVPERFNAATYFVDRNLDEGRAQNVAILFRDEEVTYQQLAANVNRAGNALRAAGVDIEQRVMLLLLDCPEFAYAFFGAVKIGAVPVPVNTFLQPHEYRRLLEDSRARVLVVSAELYTAVQPFLDGLEYLRHVFVVGDVPGSTSLGEARTRQSDVLAAANTSRDDVAFWLYTSGTTGFSRAVVHLQHDLVFCSELYFQNVLGVTESDRTYSVAKLFFAYGLGNGLYGPFAAGATTILLPDRPLPDAVFATVNRYRPTLFFAVPTAYAQMLQAAEKGLDVDMGSVRLGVSAGESLPAGIYKRWLERFGFEILDGIGTTDILHIFLTNRPSETRPGSSGKVVPGYEAKVVDDEGRPVGVDEIGTLMIKGDSICASYWNQHASTRWSIQGEWIRTGDKYHVDAEGFFWCDGRTDDMLKVGGIWVSPAEVEGAIVEHAAVLECAVVGQADEAGLIKPRAFVVLKNGSGDPDLGRDIQEFVKGRIAPYKYPRWVTFVPELPKTSTGKIQRFKLRESA